MENIMEQWKQIKDFPNYEVSNLGNFKRIAKGKGTYIGKPRKTYQNPVTKYLNVTLARPGLTCSRTFAAHRLVAETWIPNPLNLPQVNHIDRDRTNNKISNLEWVTARENSHGTKVDAINLETGEKRFFHSVNHASIELGITTYSINQVLKEQRIHVNNWAFTKHSR